MKILVTGGAGYIGSVLVPMLLNIGHKVTVLDNLMYGQTSLLDCCHNPFFRIVRGDMRNEDLTGSLVRQSDAIVHLACIVGAPACDKDPTAAKTVNYESVKNILKSKKKISLSIAVIVDSIGLKIKMVITLFFANLICMIL